MDTELLTFAPRVSVRNGVTESNPNSGGHTWIGNRVSEVQKGDLLVLNPQAGSVVGHGDTVLPGEVHVRIDESLIAEIDRLFKDRKICSVGSNLDNAIVTHGSKGHAGYFTRTDRRENTPNGPVTRQVYQFHPFGFEVYTTTPKGVGGRPEIHKIE